MQPCIFLNITVLRCFDINIILFRVLNFFKYVFNYESLKNIGEDNLGDMYWLNMTVTHPKGPVRDPVMNPKS